MPTSGDLPPIDYSVYAPQDADEMARLLAGVFSRRDPPAVAVGLTSSEFEAFVRTLCPKAAAEGLTIVARRAGERELLGALLTEDGASAPPDGMNRLSPKFEPIFDLLGQLDTEYRAGRTLHPGESLHLFLLGVAESAAGCGVAQRLVSTCLEHGARRGYRLAITEATGKVSQHVFRKLGFVERVRRSYQGHRFAGRSAFSSIAEQGGPILMDKDLRAKR